MAYLLAVSLIWGLSFSLVKVSFPGVDPALLTVLRLALALLVFLPFLQRRHLSRRIIGICLLTGALQFGLMYILLFGSYAHLQAWQVALLTIFTPIWVVLLADLLDRVWRPRHLLAACVAVVGTVVLTYRSGNWQGAGLGILAVQGANICFAAGQVIYPRLRRRVPEVRDRALFGWLYLGGLLLATVWHSMTGEWQAVGNLRGEQWLALIYLGTIASGLCFFWWNVGATQVTPGVLAVMNNLKIPAAVAIALVFFKEAADLHRLALSGLILLGALVLVHPWPTRRRPSGR